MARIIPFPFRRKAFSPQVIDCMVAAFEGVCAELDIPRTATSLRNSVADRIVLLGAEDCDPIVLREAVLRDLQSGWLIN